MDHSVTIAVLAALGVAFFLLYAAGRVGTLLKLSSLPLFILAGMGGREVIDTAQKDVLTQFASAGSVLLLFAIGLELSPRTFLKNWKSLLQTGATNAAINIPLGFGLALMLGATWQEAVFWGGIFYPTSSAIMSRLLIDLGRLANPETEHALRSALSEDLFIPLYIVVAISLASSSGAEGFEWATLSYNAAKVFGFALVVVLVGIYGGRLLERLLGSESEEVFLLGIMAHTFVIASAALAFGLSEAVGGLFAGMILAETSLQERAKTITEPLQYVFCAIFFLGFGMMIDFRTFPDVWLPAVVLAAFGIASKILTGHLVARQVGLKPRARWRLSFLLVPRGEFSIVLAATAGVTLGNPLLSAQAGLFVLLLAAAGPLLVTKGDALIPAKKKASVGPSSFETRVSVEVRKLGKL